MLSRYRRPPKNATLTYPAPPTSIGLSRPSPGHQSILWRTYQRRIYKYAAATQKQIGALISSSIYQFAPPVLKLFNRVVVVVIFLPNINKQLHPPFPGIPLSDKIPEPGTFKLFLSPVTHKNNDCYSELITQIKGMLPFVELGISSSRGFWLACCLLFKIYYLLGILCVGSFVGS